MELLPLTVKDRIDVVHGKGGDKLREVLGADVVSYFMKTREEDYKFFDGKSLEEEVALLMNKY